MKRTIFPLIPSGTLKDYVQCDDVLAIEDTLSDDWESLMTDGGRNSSETCQDGENDCDSDTTCDDQNPAKQCITLQTEWLHSTELIDYGLAKKTMLNLWT
ncbi:hypothetical protein CHS0354_033505 [Potamilus streckersoni]|uniref:Uncharacterized protein n=1 Tax=Potamilus streckersoni TaxID=2493646 RepID=A0AAE0VTQ3_9BIVA|nr:hypothetical protein CHS0354_033505 [Potamilus streckersoni]